MSVCTEPESGYQIAHRLALSERLRARRYELIDVTVPATEPQGRQPGGSTAPAELAELISSISSVGLLQPLLLEQTDRGHQVVAGERRLRALRWGHVNLPDNPNFATAPAIVCPGPLTEEERRVWQLVENLAREDLAPGELAAALMFERCAVLAAKLSDAGHPPSGEVWGIDDPVRRWHALNRHRTNEELHHLGAPWDEVIRRLGLQVTVDKARQLVRAFTALPSDLSWEMDAEDIALASRLEYLKLDRGRRDAAAEIWAALRDRGCPQLLTCAVTTALDEPDLDSEEVVDRAVEARDAANTARSLTQTPTDPDDLDENIELPDEADDGAAVEAASEVPVEVIGATTRSFDELLARLRGGEQLGRYHAGSLRLRVDELSTHLPT